MNGITWCIVLWGTLLTLALPTIAASTSGSPQVPNDNERAKDEEKDGERGSLHDFSSGGEERRVRPSLLGDFRRIRAQRTRAAAELASRNTGEGNEMAMKRENPFHGNQRPSKFHKREKAPTLDPHNHAGGELEGGELKGKGKGKSQGRGRDRDRREGKGKGEDEEEETEIVFDSDLDDEEAIYVSGSLSGSK